MSEYSRRGAAWSASEDANLRLRFQSGHGISQLMNLHGRTRLAITSRLEHQGLVADRWRCPEHPPRQPPASSSQQRRSAAREAEEAARRRQQEEQQRQQQRQQAERERLLREYQERLQEARRREQRLRESEDVRLASLQGGLRPEHQRVRIREDGRQVFENLLVQSAASSSRQPQQQQQSLQPSTQPQQVLQQQQQPPQPPPPPNRQGQRWDDTEHRQLRTRFLEGHSLTRLAEMHQRGTRGIAYRLHQMGYVEDPEACPEQPYQDYMRRNGGGGGGVARVGSILVQGSAAASAPPPQSNRASIVVPPAPRPEDALDPADCTDDTLADLYTCAVCLNVCSSPMRILSCSHTFCAHCIQSHRARCEGSNHDRCPKCRAQIDQVLPSQTSTVAIERLVVKCNRSLHSSILSIGCKWRGCFIDRARHVCVMEDPKPAKAKCDVSVKAESQLNSAKTRSTAPKSKNVVVETKQKKAVSSIHKKKTAPTNSKKTTSSSGRNKRRYDSSSSSSDDDSSSSSEEDEEEPTLSIAQRVAARMAEEVKEDERKAKRAPAPKKTATAKKKAKSR